MQDLTFGEQVKIVLSRKNMTIKDLARKIEIRTKKKMSRQNLTQRLGRDNFQEQDMRMIAEILGCSFYLDILGDHIAAEKAEKEEASAAVDNGEKKEQATAALTEKTPEEPVTRAPQGLEAGSGKETGQKPEESNSTGTGQRPEESGDTETGQKLKQSGNTETDRKPEETGSTEEGRKPGDGSGNAANEKAEDPGNKNTDEKAAAAHERDITIGELVDIHEELDAMIEKASGEPSGKEMHTGEMKKEEHADHTYGHAEPGSTDPQVQRIPEEAAEGAPPAEEGEPVEKLLEEIESMERENHKEEKTEEKQEPQEKQHGWRTYFMQRIKRWGKEQAESSGEGHADKGAETKPAAGMPAAGYQADRQEGSTYAVTGYRTDYTPVRDDAKVDYGVEFYPEEDATESGYPEADYGQNVYPVDTRGTVNRETAYIEEEYIRKAPQKEEDLGERNPYTGKEYESNSVRMHPSRIGYVQVYDRSNHQWTDMTEWAFLGYQERKKQLLGKDYDPPIYLD